MGFQILNNQNSIEPIDSKLSKLAEKSFTQTNTKQNSFEFNVFFSGYVDMFSDVETVAEYLAAHEGWFCRCAQPMKVQPLSQNGYLLNVGKFGSLGFEVEPQIAIVLEPPQKNLYQMRTVPVPDYKFPGYEVRYHSLMELSEIENDSIEKSTSRSIFANKHTAKKSNVHKNNIPKIVTRLNWQLDLTVLVEFPNLVTRFPKNLIQKSGEHLISQIVRQVSPRLSYKVQQDFHLSRGLRVPHKNYHNLVQIDYKEGHRLLRLKRNNLNLDYSAVTSKFAS